MRYAILGAGGIGGLIAAALASAGDEIILVVRPGTEASYPATLTVDGPFGRVTLHARTVAELRERVDVLWITVKATQLAAAIEQIPAQVEATAIVPLLNGIDHVQLLRDRFGAERVVAATIAVESERVAPGHIVQRSPFARLRVSERERVLVEEAMNILRRFGFDTAYVDDEATLLWSKLVFLAPIALSTTAARAPIGDVLAVDEKREKLESCVREACAVALALGARVDAEAVIANIAALPKSMRSSMQKDQASGRPMELDAIAGPILRGGEHLSIPVAVTAELTRACGGEEWIKLPESAIPPRAR